MSSNEEDNFSNSHLPVAKGTRKQWKKDSNKPVPKSTYYQWNRNLRSLENVDDTSSREVSEAADSNNIEFSKPDKAARYSSSSFSNVASSDDEYNTKNEGLIEISELEDNSSLDDEDRTEVDSLENNAGNLVDNDLLIDTNNEDECEDDPDAENFRNIGDLVTMLYDDSHISLTRSVLLIMNFYVTHKLSKVALQGILTLLQELLPQPKRMPKTLYHLFKFVEDAVISISIIKHYYCKTCLYYNGSEAQLTICSSCSSTKGFSYFYEMDLIDLIKYMFEERNLWSKLRRSHQEDGVISDITDGTEYLRVTSRLNKNEYDLTLIMNTDGISLVKSSNSHYWPLMIMIAELPEYLRESFICIIGLWHDSKKKPFMNTFLQPFCKKLVQFFHEGITWVHPVTKEICTSKIIVPLFIADAPARAEIQNIMYFTGRYGCNICEIKTQRCRRSEGQKRIRAYLFHEIPASLRNGARMEEQASVALNNNLQHKKGVKGFSVLSSLPLLNLGTCVLPEYMHSVLLGVGNQCVNLWLNKSGSWNVKQSILEVDDILLKIRPPCFFNRMPRSITLLQFYKASEFYNLILFYSLPIFVNYLPDVYFQHWILFVTAIFNLLERNIRVQPELEQSDILLRVFVRDIEELYGDRQYTYNVHQLLHLVLCIKRWGPLWSTSAFPFENMNGILASCVYGSKHLGQEIIKNLKIAQEVQHLKIMCQQDQNTTNNLENGTFQVLDEKNITIGNTSLLELIESIGVITENIKLYSRLKINKDMFTSRNYKKTKTNSYTVKLEFSNELIYGEIEIYMEIENELYIIIKPFTIDHTKMFCHRDTNTIVRHILPIIEGNQFLHFKWADIKSMTHMIRVTNYICVPPNRLHKVM